MIHLKKIQWLFRNLDSAKQRLESFFQDWESTLKHAIDLASLYLPDEIVLPDIDIVVTVGIGKSFGWPYKNIIHFDFIKLLDDFDSFREVENLLAHEFHHIGFQSYLEKNQISSSAQAFLHFLAYEGMAIKYFNHPESLYSKCINLEKQNYQIVQEDWKYYRTNHHHYFKEFRNDLSTLVNNPDSDVASIIKKWMSPNRIDTGGVLSQYPNYFLGSEIIGMLSEGYAPSQIFQIIADEKRFIKIYNTMLNNVGMSENRIELVG
jgi:uncharacterized protein YjaZ